MAFNYTFWSVPWRSIEPIDLFFIYVIVTVDFLATVWYSWRSVFWDQLIFFSCFFSYVCLSRRAISIPKNCNTLSAHLLHIKSSSNSRPVFRGVLSSSSIPSPLNKESYDLAAFSASLCLASSSSAFLFSAAAARRIAVSFLIRSTLSCSWLTSFSIFVLLRRLTIAFSRFSMWTRLT